MQRTQTTYHKNLNASEYDTLEIVRDDMDGRITIKLMEDRWRSIDETVKLLEEIIENIKTLQPESSDIFHCKICKGKKVRSRDMGMVCIDKECDNYHEKVIKVK